MFCVYILRSEKNGRYYVGSTGDLNRRLGEHNSGTTLSTKGSRPWLVVHTEQFETAALARQRESQIKAWKNPRYMERALGLATSEDR